jgi:hypothetical protein
MGLEKITTKESAKEYLRNKNIKSEDKAKHERAYFIEKTRKALGQDQKGIWYTFERVNGICKTWSTELIRDRFLLAEKYGKDFPKIWFGIRKNEQKKVD